MHAPGSGFAASVSYSPTLPLFADEDVVRLGPTHRRALRGCLWPHVGWIGLHPLASSSLLNDCHPRPVNEYGVSPGIDECVGFLSCSPGGATEMRWCRPVRSPLRGLREVFSVRLGPQGLATLAIGGCPSGA